MTDHTSEHGGPDTPFNAPWMGKKTIEDVAAKKDPEESAPKIAYKKAVVAPDERVADRILKTDQIYKPKRFTRNILYWIGGGLIAVIIGLGTIGSFKENNEKESVLEKRANDLQTKSGEKSAVGTLDDIKIRNAEVEAVTKEPPKTTPRPDDEPGTVEQEFSKYQGTGLSRKKYIPGNKTAFLPEDDIEKKKLEDAEKAALERRKKRLESSSFIGSAPMTGSQSSNKPTRNDEMLSSLERETAVRTRDLDRQIQSIQKQAENLSANGGAAQKPSGFSSVSYDDEATGNGFGGYGSARQNPNTPGYKQVQENQQFINGLQQGQTKINDSRSRIPGYVVYQSTPIHIKIINAFNSQNPSDLLAIVDEDIYDSLTQRVLLIPRGSKIYGQHSGNAQVGQKRVLLGFTRLVRPDGTEISLVGTSQDEQGRSGVPADIDNRFWDMFLTAGIVGLVGRLSGKQTTTTNTGYSTTTVSDPFTQALGQTITTILQRSSNYQPIMPLENGASMVVATKQDLRFTPYVRQ